MTKPFPDPLSRPLQGQDAYARLRDDIRQGVLKPGARLTETELAERLSISRTPVREAIRRLEADGLVDHQPRTGAVVRQLSYAEIMELYEMRTVLEGTAARLAARAASDMELQELAEITTEMAGATFDAGRIATLNRQFHSRLLDASRNRFLARSMDAIENAMLIIGPTSMAAEGRAQEAVEEHKALIQCLFDRDGEQAEAVMRAHMERAQLARLRILRAEGAGEADHGR
ncbi:GntR family transcriptional regulator [Pseudooceanicola sp. MF1-13]|uniref:GntR family transcriptional regulator n=1 Tax=Pseudooceanicola sp. MF1-13 TaxID=3379095 RepID=UPI0038915037